MKSTPITEYSKKALNEINDFIELTNWEKEPVKQTITHSSFTSIVLSVKNILDAIIMIGYNGNESDLATCAGLAEIANKLMPTNEFEFLDNLLLEKKNFSGEKIEFTPLSK